MGESILTSIKDQLSIMPEDTSFDNELKIFINAAFARLTQLGVGPLEGFRITGYEQTWDDFVIDIVQADMAKVYIYLKTKSLFDAPTNSSLSKAMEEQLKEYEWCLKLQAEE